MRVPRYRYLWVCLVLAVLAMFSCSDLPRPGPTVANLPETVDEPLVAGRPGGTFRLMLPEPFAIDPSGAREPTDFQIASYLFTGLVKTSPNRTTVPGVATRWDPSWDCSQWTFPLQRDTRFHNGEEVTSASFKRGWERATGGPMAHLLAPVQAVDASDPYVLRVTLNRPDCDFVQSLVYPVFSPVPSIAGPADNQAYNENPVGNGPFRMDGPGRRGERIRLIRNESYTIDAKANLDAVEVTITADPRTDSQQAFRAGEVDWAVPVITRDDVRSSNLPPGKLISKRGYGTTYLMVATAKPLDTAAARQAISLAIDRDAIARKVFPNADVSATSLTPPPISTDFPDTCDHCHHDPEEARRLAKIAGLTPGTVLHFGYDEQGDQARWTASVVQQLESTLGLHVNYYGLRPQDIAETLAADGASGIFGADYLAPGDVLGPLLSRSPASYRNPRVDELLETARSTRNDAQRTELYRAAEQIAVGEDLVLIPLWYRQEYRMANTDLFTNLRMDWHANADLSLISLR